jgi:DNA-binding HxlR family transcriptional regulator
MTSVTAQPRACSAARTLEIVGEKWALLAVREAFMGNRRFDEMVRRTGAPRDTLAARLRTLVGAGILERRQYAEHPARFEYDLTEAGRDLYPVILTLMSWGDRHLAGGGKPPLVLQHHGDHRLKAQLVCQECGEPVEARDTRPLTEPAPAPAPAPTAPVAAAPAPAVPAAAPVAAPAS